MTRYGLLPILAACLLVPLRAEGDHDEHDHDEHDDDEHEHDEHGHEHNHGEHGSAFEWAGIFKVPDATYMWTAQKVDGVYADETMKIAVLPASAATEEQLNIVAEEGEHALEANCTVLEPGGVITPKEDACYQLQFDADLWQSLFTIDVSGVGAVAFFTEHFPTEFESTAHYLKDANGKDVEPLAQVPKANEKVAAAVDKGANWGASIGSAILVNLVTLIGVVLAVLGFARFTAANTAIFQGVLSAFSAGALLACAFFLLLFESTHMIGEGWTKEVDTVWRWGTMVLSGFLLPAVFETLFVAVITALRARTPVRKDVVETTNDPEVADAKDAPQTSATTVRLLSAVLIGDFMHNFCDGIFIGAAFKGCGGSFGWGVTMGTVLHELPQELADYAILTGSAGLKPVQALVINFVTGWSVILGVISINAFDMENTAVGLLLAFGGGTYIYLATVECMPQIHQLNLSLLWNVVCLFTFIVGATLIGLILLDHKHCVVAAAQGPSGGGHAHGH